jgi:hypothetical protein
MNAHPPFFENNCKDVVVAVLPLLWKIPTLLQFRMIVPPLKISNGIGK